VSAGDWRPTASFEVLEARARLLSRVRELFRNRGVLEVETPLLGAAAATDLHLDSLVCRRTSAQGSDLYLQTSPELHMKRLLAAGSGPIFQLGKAFRGGESGARHNPEFTMLEWYRPGFDHHALMDEVEELLGDLLGAPTAERFTYREAFERFVGLDPHCAGDRELARAAEEHGIAFGGEPPTDVDTWRQLLLSQVIEPHLGRGRPSFVFDFPASQAALARIRPGRPPVAERFEVFLEGVELANGYHELVDAAEQEARALRDLEERRARGLPELPLDRRLLAALESGLPPCSGVALGFDRLVMLAVGAKEIAEVLAFPIERA
jgi:elongation factor P--(R)-beta-lysine ligase